MTQASGINASLHRLASGGYASLRSDSQVTSCWNANYGGRVFMTTRDNIRMTNINTAEFQRWHVFDGTSTSRVNTSTSITAMCSDNRIEVFWPRESGMNKKSISPGNESSAPLYPSTTLASAKHSPILASSQVASCWNVKYGGRLFVTGQRTIYMFNTDTGERLLWYIGDDVTTATPLTAMCLDNVIYTIWTDEGNIVRRRTAPGSLPYLVVPGENTLENLKRVGAYERFRPPPTVSMVAGSQVASCYDYKQITSLLFITSPEHIHVMKMVEEDWSQWYSGGSAPVSDVSPTALGRRRRTQFVAGDASGMSWRAAAAVRIGPALAIVGALGV